MEIILEILLQFVAELFLQILFELGFRSLIEPFKKQYAPILSFIGYILMGLVAGVLSLVFFKQLFIINPTLRIINLIITPCLAGAVMSVLGRIREKKELNLIRMDQFLYGFAFAFSMTVIRFLAGN